MLHPRLRLPEKYSLLIPMTTLRPSLPMTSPMQRHFGLFPAGLDGCRQLTMSMPVLNPF